MANAFHSLALDTEHRFESVAFMPPREAQVAIYLC